MSNHRIHAAYCRCPRCAPRHPAAHDISPVLRLAFLAFAIVGGLAVLACAGAALIDHLSSWSSL